MTATPFASTTMPNTHNKPALPMLPPKKGHKCTNSTISTHSITKDKKKVKGAKGNENNGSDEPIDKQVKRKWGKQPW